MTTLTPRARGRLARISLLLLLLGLSLQPRQATAQTAPQEIRTQYFTIYYPAGDEQTANWYAGFVDEMDVAVSELLGADPVSGLSLHIYTTEAEYQRANPLASVEPGILAHAIPEEKEVGVAVERLRQAAPEAARTSFRHEMTHVVAGALSGQNLPIGFQEGLAQYNELSSVRAESVVTTMQAAQAAGQGLLSWSSLNDRRRFQRQIDVAYPQSYGVMAYLASKYGMGAFSRFLSYLRAGQSYPVALESAYGRSLTTLEGDWRTYLPGFYKDGWRENVLTAYDLSPAVALYDAGYFAEAAAAFARAEALYTDLGRTARAADATTRRTQAAEAAEADKQVGTARQALEAHDYATAHQTATTASATFSRLNLPDQTARARAVQNLASQGLSGLAALERAQAAWARFDLIPAGTAAQEASAVFATLDDPARLAQTDRILYEVNTAQQGAGLAALAAGLLALLGGGVWAWRRRQPGTTAPRYEETPSWL